MKDSDERKLKSLEDQNDALKSVIQRMREEMESLTAAAAAASHQTERGNKSGGVYTDGEDNFLLQNEIIAQY